MPKGDIETYHDNGRWKNKVEGSSRAAHVYDTKAAGRDVAKKHRVEHIVRNQDGTIHERSAYGHDPRDMPGQRPVAVMRR
jgi:hypothetical protein